MRVVVSEVPFKYGMVTVEVLGLLSFCQRFTLESWYKNLKQTTLYRCQPLPTPYR